MKVLKFGGSSVADAVGIMRVSEIIKSDSEADIVVVSAPGKRFKGDDKITDLLIKACFCAKNGGNYKHYIELVEQRYVEIKEELGLSINLDEVFSDIYSSVLIEEKHAFVVSRGEYVLALMVAELLSFEFVDASSAIVFDYTGVVNEEASKAKINQCLKRYKKIVVPGFYGGYPNGAIKLFERGGGDITGALLASFVGVDYYENWTDVSGVLSADPHLVEEPFTIPEVTYNEMRLLSCSGAQVLHRDAIKPLEKLGISMRIKNTLFPCDKGTLIKKTRGNCKQFFSSVTVKNNMFSVCFKGKEKEIALVFNLLSKCSSLNSLVALDDGYRVLFEIINADLFECARKELLQKIEDAVLECNLSVVSVIMCGKSFSCSDFSSAVNIVGNIANRGCCFPNLNDNLMSFCVGSDEVDAVVLSLHNAFCGYNAQ